MRATRRLARPRGANLTDERIKEIAELIDGWTGALTWQHLVDEIAVRTKGHYTRQALFKHERIRHAFQLRKRSLRRDAGERGPHLSSQMQAATQTIDRLTAKVERLESENQRLLNQFVVWSFNVRIRGIDENTLNQPLPPVHRI